MPPSAAQTRRNRKGGFARAQQLGPGGMAELGRTPSPTRGRPNNSLALQKANQQELEAEAMSKPGRPCSR